EEGLLVVFADRIGHQSLCRDGRRDGQTRPVVVCDVDRADDHSDRSAHPECRVCFRAGTHLSRREETPLHCAVCCRWTHGVDGLPDAVGMYDPAVLSLHDWPLWTCRSSHWLGSDDCLLCCASGIEQLVAQVAPLRPNGMALARHDVWYVPVYDEGCTSSACCSFFACSRSIERKR